MSKRVPTLAAGAVGAEENGHGAEEMHEMDEG
jgi:hypothetical protein